MNKFLIRLLLITALLGNFPVTEQAQAATGLNVGIVGVTQFGLLNGNPEAQGVLGGSFNYKIPFGFQFGVEYLNVGFAPTHYLVGTIDYFVFKGLFVGINAGAVFSDSIQFALGPELGWDFEIGSWLTIGPKIEFELSHLTGNILGALNTLATIKFHF